MLAQMDRVTCRRLQRGMSLVTLQESTPGRSLGRVSQVDIQSST